MGIMVYSLSWGNAGFISRALYLKSHEGGVAWFQGLGGSGPKIPT